MNKSQTDTENFPGMTPLLRDAVNFASYNAPVGPNELTVRLLYVAAGGALSLLLIALGCVLVYAKNTFSDNDQLLVTCSVLLGFLGFCVAVIAGAVVLCRAYKGLYTKGIDIAACEMTEVGETVQLVEAIDALQYDPAFSAVLKKQTSTVQVVRWIEKRIQEKQPALARLFHTAA